MFLELTDKEAAALLELIRIAARTGIDGAIGGRTVAFWSDALATKVADLIEAYLANARVSQTTDTSSLE